MVDSYSPDTSSASKQSSLFGSIKPSDTETPESYLSLIESSEKRFRTLYENVTDGVLIIDNNYLIKYVNDRTCEISGFSRDELIGNPCDIVCPKGSASKECPIWAKNNDSFTGMDTAIKCKSGGLNPILKNAKVIDIDDQPHICESFSDISYLKEIESCLTKRNKELKGILESAPIGIGLISDMKITEINEQFAKILGYKTSEIIGKDIRKLNNSATAEKMVEKVLKTRSYYTQEVVLKHKDNSDVNTIVSLDLLDTESEEKKSDILFTVLDITEATHAREEIWKQAYYDKLTELPNRAHILNELQKNIDNNDEISLILFDLNKFKEVNDNYGHLAGDELLRQVSSSLTSFIKEPNFTGRLGGDEFIIIVHTRDKGELEEFCTSICDLINKRCILEERTVRVSASLGVVSDADKVNDYLLRADLAMYEAKNISKMRPAGAFKFFTPSMLKSYEIQSQMKQTLLDAFSNNEFDIMYQPIYNITTMTIEGVEALLRWDHPTYGAVAPQVVIPIADETGVLIPIGHWMIDEVGRVLKSLQDKVPQLHDTGFYISINMTLQQLSDPDLISVFDTMLETHGISGKMIMIDISDTSALDTSKWSLSIVKNLKKHGVRISIDDFGIGYSALSTVERSSINILKIDRSYIAKLHIEKNMEITNAIIKLAKALSLEVIAEGVETLEQFKQVRELECTAAQGFYLNEPLSRTDLHDLIYNLYI